MSIRCQVHNSHCYKVPDDYADKYVLVMGFGNSAMDIAVETSRVSAMTYLAVRRGFHEASSFSLFCKAFPPQRKAKSLAERESPAERCFPSFDL